MNASQQLWVPPSADLGTYRKADPPPTGPAFGPWAGERDLSYATLPGGGVLAFDLSKLTLEDYRQMRSHYQVNASLAILTFMLHQLDWHIECEDQKIADECERQLRRVWTRLIRGLSQAFWAGYSPMVIEYDNNLQERSIEISKFKDLVPENCEVNWEEVDGYIPPEYRNEATVAPKLKVFDGIKVKGQRWPVPVENSLWYPVLMENGNYYGRKLLKPAFQSWFFSILIHLFANRYFERFGEPLPIGRADFEADVEIGGGDESKVVNGRQAMEHILERLRSRSVVVLPSQRHPETNQYDFDLEYLESQMRGADFERYLMRLDEEITLALFTPLLLMRTADVGSYNLGETHIQMFLWMLNALAGDIKEYIDRYVLERIKAYNFTPNAPRVEWVPRKMGNQDKDTIKAVMTEMVRGGNAKPDIDELGQAVGLNLKEVRQVTGDDDPNPDAPDPDPRTGGGRPERDESSGGRRRGFGQPRATTRQIASRMRPQLENAFERGTFGTADFTPSLGYQRRMEQAWMAEGTSRDEAERRTKRFYDGVNRWLKDAQSIGADEYEGADDFMQMFERVLDTQLEMT